MQPGPPHGRGHHAAGQAASPSRARRASSPSCGCRCAPRCGQHPARRCTAGVRRRTRPLAESLRLFERLARTARELDDELKRLEREPDKGRLATQLPELRERTERITHSADSLRWAAQDRAQRFADDDLDALGARDRHARRGRCGTGRTSSLGAPAPRWPGRSAPDAGGLQRPSRRAGAAAGPCSRPTADRAARVDARRPTARRPRQQKPPSRSTT